MRVVAEQIAWTKAKSERIGLRIPITNDVALALLLEHNNGGEGENLREGLMLCAPLVTRDSVVGVLKIAARSPEQLTRFDAELVEHFRSPGRCLGNAGG